MVRGRNLKDGLDYFSMDVHLDDKFQLIEAEYGLKGFAVIIKLYQKIYGGFGYYCKWDDEVSLLFRSKCGLGGNDVSEIVSAAVRRGIFDERLLKTYGILTSSGIQKRYFEAAERRKAVKVFEEYLLLNISDLPSNVCINSINVDINSENAYRNSQSKVKESKVKESTTPGGRPAFDTVEAYASSNLVNINPRQMQELESFRDELPDELIRHAIDESCLKGKPYFTYASAIMQRYVDQGYRKLEDALQEEKQRKAAQQPAIPKRKVRVLQ